jgi:hypothetical protein
MKYTKQMHVRLFLFLFVFFTVVSSTYASTTYFVCNRATEETSIIGIVARIYCNVGEPLEHINGVPFYGNGYWDYFGSLADVHLNKRTFTPGERITVDSLIIQPMDILFCFSYGYCGASLEITARNNADGGFVSVIVPPAPSYSNGTTSRQNWLGYDDENVTTFNYIQATDNAGQSGAATFTAPQTPGTYSITFYSKTITQQTAYGPYTLVTIPYTVVAIPTVNIRFSFFDKIKSSISNIF